MITIINQYGGKYILILILTKLSLVKCYFHFYSTVHVSIPYIYFFIFFCVTKYHRLSHFKYLALCVSGEGILTKSASNALNLSSDTRDIFNFVITNLYHRICTSKSKATGVMCGAGFGLLILKSSFQCFVYCLSVCHFCFCQCIVSLFSTSVFEYPFGTFLFSF